jgi:hypothetical protein
MRNIFFTSNGKMWKIICTFAANLPRHVLKEAGCVVDIRQVNLPSDDGRM